MSDLTIINENINNLNLASYDFDERIHVAFAIWDLSDDYNRHAGVAIVSLLENTKHQITIHLLYDSRESVKNEREAELNKSKYNQIATKYQSEILFHDVTIPDSITEIPAVKIYTAASLLRLYLPEILPKLDKIIYLDTDIVITMDIASLWNINLGNYAVAARLGNPKKMPYMRKRRYRCMGIDPYSYFNSGVLYLNLNKIQSTMNLPEQAFSYLKANSASGWPDQDALNFLLQKMMLPIEEKYNFLSSGLTDIGDYSNCILHFAGRNKPWNIYYGGPDRYYWKYLVMSPWGENRNTLLCYARDAPDLDKATGKVAQWILFASPVIQIKRFWKIIFKSTFNLISFGITHIIKGVILGKNYTIKK